MKAILESERNSFHDHFHTPRSSDYPQLSVAQKIYPHGVRGSNERCPVHANDGAPEMRER